MADQPKELDVVHLGDDLHHGGLAAASLQQHLGTEALPAGG